MGVEPQRSLAGIEHRPPARMNGPEINVIWMQLVGGEKTAHKIRDKGAQILGIRQG